MKKNIGTPEGTRDRLFAECSAVRRISASATEVFRRFGYSELTTPNVEYYDVITATDYPLPQESMMKIVERTGKIMVMRPDNTVAIGRVAATKLHSLALPLRLYYHQTVYRSDDINTGARSEIDQCGVELLGASGIRADLEMLVLSLNVLKACGLHDYHIEIGHAGYVSSLLSSLTEDQGATLRELLEEKNFVAYSEALSKMPDFVDKEALMALPRMFGGVEVLDKARSLTKNATALEAVEYLARLYEMLQRLGYQDNVRVDLSLSQSIEYYTGMIFRGYGQGAGTSVLSGGRYDSLIGHFGKDIPATGFSLDVDAVSDCFYREKHPRPETLLWYNFVSLRTAMEIMEKAEPETMMLSCADTPEAAEQEAMTLGAKKLMLIQDNIIREVCL